MIVDGPRKIVLNRRIRQRQVTARGRTNAIILYFRASKVVYGNSIAVDFMNELLI